MTDAVIFSVANVTAGLTFAWYLSGRLAKIEVLLDTVRSSIDDLNECKSKCVAYEYRLKMLEKKEVAPAE